MPDALVLDHDLHGLRGLAPLDIHQLLVVPSTFFEDFFAFLGRDT